ncbi:hypothetical protein MYXO_01244 [Myxococcaceae bacterium]|jgi:nitrogen fixation protein FixH|nr:hypothetical protein MYXO_01244 [Myxococcaceae bacterium]
MSLDARTHEPWPWILGALLAAMVTASLAFAVIASRHPDPTLVDDSWASEPALAESLRARQLAEDRGWALEVRTREAAGGVHVEVALRDASGRELDPERIRMRRERPAEAGFDTEFDLERSGGGFVGLVPLPKPGRWTITVSAERDGGLVEKRVPVGAAR